MSETDQKVATGFVTNCFNTIVRVKPIDTSYTVGIISEGSMVTVDYSKSSDRYYFIKADYGVIGYTERDHVEIRDHKIGGRR